MRVAIIGCGFQGRLHAQSYLAMDDVEVVTAVDPDPARRQEMESLGVPSSYESYETMLESAPDLDAVSICTMPVHHRHMALSAFEHGWHVLCEKPIALDAAEAADMCQAAERAGKVLAVGFNMRFMQSPRRVRALVEEGRLGDPVHTRVWGRSSHIPWWGEHYRKEVSGGGALAATAVHLLDLGLWFAGFPEPSAVSASATTLFPRKRRTTAPSTDRAARYNTEDLFSAHVRFEGGFWMTVDGSWVYDRPSSTEEPVWDYSVDAVGSRAQAQVDPLGFYEEDDQGTIRDATGEEVGSMDFPSSVAELVADFVDAVRTGRAPAVPGREALVTQRVVDAIYRSAAEGREVPVSDPEG